MPTTFSLSVKAASAQAVTPISGTAGPVSAFWAYSAARTRGTPYAAGWVPSAALVSCDNGMAVKYGDDFGQVVAARSVSLGLYVSGSGPLPIVIKYSDDNRTWTTAAKLNPSYGSTNAWIRASGSWNSAAARYWAIFYEGGCGSADAFVSQFQLSN